MRASAGIEPFPFAPPAGAQPRPDDAVAVTWRGRTEVYASPLALREAINRPQLRTPFAPQVTTDPPGLGRTILALAGCAALVGFVAAGGVFGLEQLGLLR